IAEFDRVLAERPGDPAARAGLGEAYVHTRQTSEGLALLRTVAAENPDDGDTKRALALALYHQALDGLAELPEGKVAMSARQVSLLRRNVTEIRGLAVSDPQVDAFLADLQGLLDDARKRVRIRSHNLRYYLAGLGLGLLIAAFAPTEFFQVVAAAIIVGTVLLYVRRHRPPAWRVRRKEHGRRVIERGI
ncbi:MAG TPA: tetratricopeptide repeat protein, partial [Actinopolymorphaceae bacterium]